MCWWPAMPTQSRTEATNARREGPRHEVSVAEIVEPTMWTERERGGAMRTRRWCDPGSETRGKVEEWRGVP